MKLSEIDCQQVENLDGIQGAGTTDKTGKYKGIDKNKVSCMQKYYLDEDGKQHDANELKMMIKNHYKKFENDEKFYQALCDCCQQKEKDFPGITGDNQWEKLYKCLDSKGYKKS